jgi:raffinose/stachyose/melibiose transport system permease protein
VTVEVASRPQLRSPRRRPVSMRTRVVSIIRHVVLVILSVAWIIPLYVVIINAFKSQDGILSNAFTFAVQSLSLKYMWHAITNPDFNVLASYGFTALLVVLNMVFVVAFAAPISYLIARSVKKRYQMLLIYFLLGTFIPGQVILVPVTKILLGTGLMGSLWGLLAFQVAGSLPITIFLFVGYIRTIPREIDEAAEVDGAGLLRRFWQIIFPLIRPIVATVVILTGMGVWNDFVNPQIILGPLGPKTVTTGIYAAVGKYITDYTTVFPDLLLALAPALIFFILMQRNIIGGLTAGATKS